MYVFTRSSTDDGTFTQQSKLHANDAAATDYFGGSVSLSGDTALIGAMTGDDDNKMNSGSVYVFTRSSVDGTFTNSLNSTRAMRQMTIVLVNPFLCTATRR